MSTSELRPMTPGDANDVAIVHLAAFPGFFLSFLGPRFLTVFYAALADDSNGIAYVALAGSAVIGFVAGSMRPRDTYRRLLRRRWLSIIAAVAGACMRKPVTLWRIIARAIARTTESNSRRRGAELMSLGVIPNHRHHGVGRDLVQRFVSECRRRSADAVTLSTDAAENEGVNAFYASLGFALVSTRRTREGRLTNDYRIEFRTN